MPQLGRVQQRFDLVRDRRHFGSEIGEARRMKPAGLFRA